jgi:hypothetical protein
MKTNLPAMRATDDDGDARNDEAIRKALLDRVDPEAIVAAPVAANEGRALVANSAMIAFLIVSVAGFLSDDTGTIGIPLIILYFLGLIIADGSSPSRSTIEASDEERARRGVAIQRVTGAMKNDETFPARRNSKETP